MLNPKMEIHKLQGDRAHVGDVEVVRDVRHTTAGEHVGGVDGIGCQYFQAMTTQLLQEHWECLEDRRKDIWQGSQKRLAMYIASMDIKTVFDKASIHGVLLLFFVTGCLEGQATFEKR